MSTTRKVNSAQRLALEILAAHPGGISNDAFTDKMQEKFRETWTEKVSELYDDGIIRSPTNKKRTKLDTKRLMLSEDGLALCRELEIRIARSASMEDAQRPAPESAEPRPSAGRSRKFRPRQTA